MDWVYVAAICSTGALILTGAGIIINFVIAQKIMGNHLAHIAQDLKEIKDTTHRIGIRQDTHAERIAHLEGIIEEK